MRVDTSNILFICGGTFNGLERIISNRLGNKVIGFEADIKGQGDMENNDILSQVQPEDLIKFGLIPEFVGRIPITATLNNLSLDALVRILKEPKNALIKQYKKLFEMENVNLRFTDDVLTAIAKDAIKRKSGARGLRAILESVMLDIMYDIPSTPGITECVINEDVVAKGEPPLLIYEKQAKFG